MRTPIPTHQRHDEDDSPGKREQPTPDGADLIQIVSTAPPQISLILGILIWQQWPEASLIVIGLFVGIDLIFTGWTWMMLALAVKNLRPRT